MADMGGWLYAGTGSFRTANGSTTLGVYNDGSAAALAQRPDQPVFFVRGFTAQTADLLQLQDISGAVLAKIDAGGNLTVKNATFNGTLTVNGHIITGNTSGSTSVAIGPSTSCSGGAPSVVISGNDTAGMVTFSTGTGACPASNNLGTITFANPYSVAPRVTLTPAGVNGANLKYCATNATTTTIDICTGSAPAASTQYSFFYHIEQ